MAEPNLRDVLRDVLALARATGGPQDSGGVPYTVIPMDCKLESLAQLKFSRYAEHPQRIVQGVSVNDSASFCTYYALFADPNSRVFADEKKSQVLAIMDYHGAAEGAPRWGDHRLLLTLEHSDQWKDWMGKNGQAHKMSQLEFAEFIEDHTPDILSPDAATMLEMSRTLSAKTDVDYSSAIRLANGQVQLTYNEAVRGTFGSGKLEIPEFFTITVPVYFNGPRLSVQARLRYRLVSGKLSIWYDLLHASDLVHDAFRSELVSIKERLQEEVINGELPCKAAV